MPSPVCSCITAGFGVKFLRRYRISIPHGLLSPVGHPGYKNDRGERVSSKTGDRSIYAAGPPSAKAGGDLPTMRRHNTCRAKKHSTHRRVSPTLATGTEKRARRPIRHPHVCLAPYVRKNQVGCRLGRVGFTGFPYAKASSPIVCSQWSAARFASHQRAFPLSSEPCFGSGPFPDSRGKGAHSPGTTPSRRRTEAIRRGYRTSRNSLKTTSFLAM